MSETPYRALPVSDSEGSRQSADTRSEPARTTGAPENRKFESFSAGKLCWQLLAKFDPANLLDSRRIYYYSIQALYTIAFVFWSVFVLVNSPHHAFDKLRQDSENPENHDQYVKLDIANLEKVSAYFLSKCAFLFFTKYFSIKV